MIDVTLIEYYCLFSAIALNLIAAVICYEITNHKIIMQETDGFYEF